MALLEELVLPHSRGRKRVEVFDPATLERLGEVEFANRSDVNAQVARAQRAAPAWGALDPEDRARCVGKLRDLIFDRSDEIAEVICRDTGKLRIEATAFEISPSTDALNFYARRAPQLLRDEPKRLRLLQTKKLAVTYLPRGVVGIVTGCVLPFFTPVNLAAQALMAGNVVVLKPSEWAPRVAELLVELFADAGFPSDTARVIVGDAEAGRTLVSAGCDMVAFSGSAAAGRTVAEACARQLVPATLTLESLNAMVVCSDADLSRASQAAVWGAFADAGQPFTATQCVYVTQAVASDFTERVVQTANSLRQGPEAEGEVDVGGLAHPAQLEVLEQQIADALSKGAKLRTGGRRNPNYAGCFFEPTVLTDVNEKMDVLREYTPGPVLAILAVADLDEVAQRMSAAPAGLVASVWSADSYGARQFGRRLRVGGVILDGAALSDSFPESPFGGIKQSGVGRVNGELGLKSFCSVQSVVQPRFRLGRDGLRYPYEERTLRGTKRRMRLLYRSPLGRFFGA